MSTGRRTKGRKGARSVATTTNASTPAPVPPLPKRFTVYLAPPQLETELMAELGERVLHRHGPLILAEGPPLRACWAQDVWRDPRVVSIRSIGDAAAQLREVQRNWVGRAVTHHRRMALIEDKLPPIRARKWTFPVDVPTTPLGAYTLLDRDTLLYSATRHSAFPNGEIHFEEDHEGPPSRAYRKLWEALTLVGEAPQPGSRCIDMGASPGGWTWALAQLGANVRAVDKARLDPAVAALPNVKVWTKSAFGIDPSRIEAPYDWFFSDVICEPRRLLTMVQRWRAAKAAKRFVCSIKFRGETDHETVETFRRIEGSRLVHLWHNRHELTWIACPNSN